MPVQLLELYTRVCQAEQRLQIYTCTDSCECGRQAVQLEGHQLEYSFGSNAFETKASMQK